MPVPVLSVPQMREWERATWAAGRSEEEVIAQVGRIVAARALELTRPGDTILLLAGKGHNGDDVRQAQPHFAGRNARLLNVTEPAAALPELSRSLARRPALVIDGLFGIGLNRPLNDAWRKFIEAINAANLPVLAVDCPSGLDAETGQPQGAAMRAMLTLTLGAPKRGLLRSEAVEFIGRLEVALDIGLAPCPCQSELLWTLPGDFIGFPPPRRVAAHKGSYGHLAIVAGSLGYHGAAVLAARGALRAQPGLVTVFPQQDVYAPVAGQLAQAMVHPWKPVSAFPKSTTAVLFGPGLAAETLPQSLKEEFRQVWSDSSLAVIADASALDWLPEGPVRPNALRIITPHPGEAARLLGATNAKVQSDRLGALRELSRRWGRCLVVLKGHQTLVGSHAGEVFINSSGNPHLAQGGSGDALAGFLAGLLAQPALQADAIKAARFAVWAHGAAADRLQGSGRAWTVEELIAELAGSKAA